MPKLEPGEEVDGTPYDFDRWVLKIAAAFTAQMPASSGAARLYWQLVMDIGPGARYWMEDFFHGWFMTGSKFATSQNLFAEHWGETHHVRPGRPELGRSPRTKLSH
jgi:hypothetical protein